ncbi:hypothetical protein KEC58_21160 (plasmid) [Photobacterium damselae]|uniref:hypothetical protein n=1 Tax=Photobacterium damselae TaxID=38293 RepID=UPI0025433936
MSKDVVKLSLYDLDLANHLSEKFNTEVEFDVHYRGYNSPDALSYFVCLDMNVLSESAKVLVVSREAAFKHKWSIEHTIRMKAEGSDRSDPRGTNWEYQQACQEKSDKYKAEHELELKYATLLSNLLTFRLCLPDLQSEALDECLQAMDSLLEPKKKHLDLKPYDSEKYSALYREYKKDEEHYFTALIEHTKQAIALYVEHGNASTLNFPALSINEHGAIILVEKVLTAHSVRYKTKKHIITQPLCPQYSAAVDCLKGLITKHGDGECPCYSICRDEFTGHFFVIETNKLFTKS